MQNTLVKRADKQEYYYFHIKVILVSFQGVTIVLYQWYIKRLLWAKGGRRRSGKAAEMEEVPMITWIFESSMHQVYFN